MAESARLQDQVELIESLVERAKAEPALIGVGFAAEVRRLAASIADDPAQQAIARRLDEAASVIENLQKRPGRMSAAWSDFRTLPPFVQACAAFLAAVAVVCLIARLNHLR
jgi:hypothetical protein